MLPLLAGGRPRTAGPGGPPRSHTTGLRLAVVLAGATGTGCAAPDGRPRSPPEAAPATSSRSRARVEEARVALFVPTPERGPSETCDALPCRELVALIDEARHTLDLAVYGVRGAPSVVAAIDRARRRGVRVRAVVDRTPDGGNIYRDTDAFLEHVDAWSDDGAFERRARRRRRTRRVPATDRCPRPPGTRGPLQCLAYDLGDRCLLQAAASREPFGESGAIMHNKFAVADGRLVFTGSANVSDTGVGGYNANVVVRLRGKGVAGLYTAYFQHLFRGGFHAPSAGRLPSAPVTFDAERGTVTVAFSPMHRPMVRVVRPVLRRARRRVDVAVFFLTHKHVTQDLIDAHLRGVKVRVILDATGARNAYSKHHVLRAAGIPVKVENLGGKLHAKAAAIDGRFTVAGSMNWTTAGDRTNDENVLLFDDPSIANGFHEAFDRLYERIPGTFALRDPDPESRLSGMACRDGVDNDYDGAVDRNDPGCSAPEPAPAPAVKVVPKPESGVCTPALWNPP